MMGRNYIGAAKYVIVGGALLLGGYYVAKSNKQTEELRSEIQALKETKQTQEVDKVPEAQVVEKVVMQHEAWRDIQERVRNTVVQVFSQVAEIDILQPYKTPSQYKSSGSGFFIDDKGYIITNAHVVIQAKSVWVQIPHFGKRIFDTTIVGIAPDHDLALLRMSDEGVEVVRRELGAIPYLQLGDSDSVHRADEVMALGYPLGQESLKSTTGVISGRESTMIQMSAAINPGSSGGPLLNIKGQVIGINTAMVMEAQNAGYIIPVNDLKIILPSLFKEKIVRKPFLGILFNNATDALTEYLGNPQPGGPYIVEVVKNSTLYKAGVLRGDMIYEINGHRVDQYGEMNVPWTEDKISITDFVSRLSIGDKVSIVLYRNGKRKEVTTTFKHMDLMPIRKVYPNFEDIDYETFAGMVIMELTINHVAALANKAPALANFADIKNQSEPVLIVTHVFPTSYVARTRTLSAGTTINEVNGQIVHSLEDFRKAVKKSVDTGFLTLRVSDNIMHISDHVFIVLPFDRVIGEEQQLAFDYRYPFTALNKELAFAWNETNAKRELSRSTNVA
jgi:serine protease Do